mgnify:CR=1 FL=1|jgi:hypothetical protein
MHAKKVDIRSPLDESPAALGLVTEVVAEPLNLVETVSDLRELRVAIAAFGQAVRVEQEGGEVGRGGRGRRSCRWAALRKAAVHPGGRGVR